MSVTIGVISGLITPLVGYGLTYLLLASTAKDLVLKHAPTYGIAQDVIPIHLDGMATWKVVGWLFYNAHGGQVKFTVVDQLGANSLNFIAYESGVNGWLWILPAAIILLTASLVVLLTTLRGLRAGAIVGATVAIGYAIVMAFVLGEFAVSVTNWRMTLPFSFSAVIGFPLLFGIIGGAVTGYFRST